MTISAEWDRTSLGAVALYSLIILAFTLGWVAARTSFPWEKVLELEKVKP